MATRYTHRRTLLEASTRVTVAHRKQNRDYRTHSADFMAIIRDPDTTLAIYLEEDEETRAELGPIAGTREERKAAKALRDANPDDDAAFEDWNRMDAANAVLNRNSVYKSHVGRALCRIRDLPLDKPSKGFEDCPNAAWIVLREHAVEFPNAYAMERWGKYGGDPANPNQNPTEGQGPRHPTADDADDADAVELPDAATDIVEAARTLYGDGCADSVAGILAYWEEKTNRNADDADDEEE